MADLVFCSSLELGFKLVGIVAIAVVWAYDVRFRLFSLSQKLANDCLRWSLVGSVHFEGCVLSVNLFLDVRLSVHLSCDS